MFRVNEVIALSLLKSWTVSNHSGHYWRVSLWL